MRLTLIFNAQSLALAACLLRATLSPREQARHEDLRLGQELGCQSVSPLGIRWAYAQPQHAGTDTVIFALRKHLNLSKCMHDHDVPKRGFANDSISFTFVANVSHLAPAIASLCTCDIADCSAACGSHTRGS